MHSADFLLQNVTPLGFLTLAQRCPQLAVLRYACKEGRPSLEQQHLLELAAACPQLRQLDLSLHQQLDDGCMAVLASCVHLLQVRSHTYS
jgi:hypothetical protein